MFTNAAELTLHHSKASRSDEYGEAVAEQAHEGDQEEGKALAGGLSKVDTEVASEAARGQANTVGSREDRETPWLGKSDLVLRGSSYPQA